MNNQVKLIDADKLLKWLEESPEAAKFWITRVEPIEKYDLIEDAIGMGMFDPDTPPVPTIKPGDRVLHGIHGLGTAVSEEITHGNTVFVNFDEQRCGPHIILVRNLEVVETK